ncbi:hypothetical protein HHI36_017438 [Cryptolaemus montrouzieri]|uniref:Uncharacterized protein n=1 Tax=Cryptolaemus montrouzieri TaxID=559131 RepID=A0ABD2NNB6_9CUCU
MDRRRSIDDLAGCNIASRKKERPYRDINHPMKACDASVEIRYHPCEIGYWPWRRRQPGTSWKIYNWSENPHAEDLHVEWVSETHWRESGHFETRNGNMVICSSNNQESINEVAIILHKSIKHSLIGYETINDRIRTDCTHPQWTSILFK